MELDKNLIQMSEFFKALSDPTRLRIIVLLSSADQLCVNMIAQKTGMTQPAISQHLKILRHAGIIDVMKKGLYMHYRLNDAFVTEYNSVIGYLVVDRKKQDCITCSENNA